MSILRVCIFLTCFVYSLKLSADDGLVEFQKQMRMHTLYGELHSDVLPIVEEYLGNGSPGESFGAAELVLYNQWFFLYPKVIALITDTRKYDETWSYPCVAAYVSSTLFGITESFTPGLEPSGGVHSNTAPCGGSAEEIEFRRNIQIFWEEWIKKHG